MPPRELNTTSYALLALLAVKPWTTYELANQMGRGVAAVWPRATSGIYEEPKNLVRHGLATATKDYTGRRASTRYAITAAGRRALRRWLDEPGGGPSLEYEAMVKVMFADHGTLEQLRAQLEAIRADAEQRMADAHERMREYRETGGPFPHRLPVISLAARFHYEQAQALCRWVRWASEAVDDWDGVTPERGASVPPDAFSSRP